MLSPTGLMEKSLVPLTSSRPACVVGGPWRPHCVTDSSLQSVAPRLQPTICVSVTHAHTSVHARHWCQLCRPPSSPTSFPLSILGRPSTLRAMDAHTYSTHISLEIQVGHSHMVLCSYHVRNISTGRLWLLTHWSRKFYLPIISVYNGSLSQFQSFSNLKCDKLVYTLCILFLCFPFLFYFWLFLCSYCTVAISSWIPFHFLLYRLHPAGPLVSLSFIHKLFQAISTGSKFMLKNVFSRVQLHNHVLICQLFKHIGKLNW